MSEQDPIRRFTNRAENYARFRPGYPQEVIDCLRRECELTPLSIVADVGAGTGILTGLFLRHGNRVFAVEPNEAMRREAERALAQYGGFTSIDGRAEATTLDDDSVDLVVAGQAFHWFDATASRVEFARILRPGGFVALVWNARAYQGDPLMEAYERVLGEHGMGYHFVRHRSHDRDMGLLFTEGYESRAFSQTRELDYDTFWGGFLSSSYAPLPGDPRYEPVRQQLRNVFEAHQRDGRVTFRYDTRLYFARLAQG